MAGIFIGRCYFIPNLLGMDKLWKKFLDQFGDACNRPQGWSLGLPFDDTGFFFNHINGLNLFGKFNKNRTRLTLSALVEQWRMDFDGEDVVERKMAVSWKSFASLGIHENQRTNNSQTLEWIVEILTKNFSVEGRARIQALKLDFGCMILKAQADAKGTWLLDFRGNFCPANHVSEILFSENSAYLAKKIGIGSFYAGRDHRAMIYAPTEFLFIRLPETAHERLRWLAAGA